MTISAPVATSARFSNGRLAATGLGAVVAAVVANVVIRAIAVSVVNVPAAFTPLHASSVITLTVFGVIGATIACLLLNRFTDRPVGTFRTLAPIALALSFIPDALIWLSHSYGHTARASTVFPLLLMHVAAAAICIVALPAFARER
jgi:hypothetical protein